MGGNVGAAATGLLQPTRLAVELIYIYKNRFETLKRFAMENTLALAFMEDVCMCRYGKGAGSAW